MIKVARLFVKYASNNKFANYIKPPGTLERLLMLFNHPTRVRNGVTIILQHAIACATSGMINGYRHRVLRGIFTCSLNRYGKISDCFWIITFETVRPGSAAKLLVPHRLKLRVALNLARAGCDYLVGIDLPVRRRTANVSVSARDD